MKTTAEWIEAQTVDLDSQKSAHLAARLSTLGFSGSQIEQATSVVKASGAYDAMDTKPSSVGAFVRSVKALLSHPSRSQSSASQYAEVEPAHSL